MLQSYGQALNTYRSQHGSAPIYNLCGLKILMAEDNPLLQLVGQKIITRWKGEFYLANNGLEAVEMVRKGRYDLVLMDLQMPLMDGYEAATAIRRIDARLPLIAVSADSDEDDMDDAFRAGMNDYITKPYNQQELYQKIITHTSRR